MITRLLFSVAAALLVAGGSLDGNYKSSNLTSIGQKLVKAGYLVFAGILGILIIFHVYLWARKVWLNRTSMIVSGTNLPTEKARVELNFSPPSRSLKLPP